jgi:hypothetical protein
MKYLIKMTNEIESAGPMKWAIIRKDNYDDRDVVIAVFHDLQNADHICEYWNTKYPMSYKVVELDL